MSRSEMFRRLRARHGFSAEYVASVCDVSVAELLGWESGKRKPGLKGLVRLCMIYHIPTQVG